MIKFKIGQQQQKRNKIQKIKINKILTEQKKLASNLKMETFCDEANVNCSTDTTDTIVLKTPRWPITKSCRVITASASNFGIGKSILADTSAVLSKQ